MPENGEPEAADAASTTGNETPGGTEEAPLTGAENCLAGAHEGQKQF